MACIVVVVVLMTNAYTDKHCGAFSGRKGLQSLLVTAICARRVVILRREKEGEDVA